MKPLKQFRGPLINSGPWEGPEPPAKGSRRQGLRSPTRILLTGAAIAFALATGGCAGTKPRETTGTGGSGLGGSGGPPPIGGLESLDVNPKMATVTLTAGSSPGTLTSMPQKFTATGVVNGVSMDVSDRVSWLSDLKGVMIMPNGTVTATAPGVYTITAKSGSIMSSGQLTASFSGAIFDPKFDQTNNNKMALDATPSGPTAIAYPVDHALFPGNMTPIYAHMTTSGAIARLSFQATGLDIQYYANCVSTDDTNLDPVTHNPDPFPGTGCYVKMPLTLTQLFIATSERQDIKMTARVFAAGASQPVESPSINVAWANVGLSGGLYYWSTIPITNPSMKATMENAQATPPNYILLDPTQTSGTAIYRYDFTNGTPAPNVVWTDDGGPQSVPPYQGGPAAVNNNVGKGHCIGCHAISNDGKYMALTIGGSASDAANTAILDIGQQTLININMAASTIANSSPTYQWADYFKRFRVEAVAAENAWGPNADRMVSMFRSKLYLTQVTVTGTTGTVARSGTAPIMPSWTEYASDPFWSLDGSLFAFTSFDQPDIGTYNPDGLNGDMKRRGKIAMASADANGVHDDAHDIVPRMNNVTSFYPSISNDNKLVVFNQSTCGTDPDVNRPDVDPTRYGNQTCDGYDDSSSTVWIVSPGGNPVRLDAANGPAGSGNSWPRFSPDKGYFRGQLIYWIAFSSRRAYGTQVNNYNPPMPAATHPQLWVAAVRTGEVIVGDPSWAPVWLPTQNPKQAAPQGNHVPQWVKFVVVING
jgi:WD40-like Beta Propeller Repeat